MIRFVNLPLAQFLIDIALVVVYWLLAITAEGANPAIPRPTSAVPEARYVAVAFLLYGAWDLVALRIRRVEAAASAATGTDVPARRRVTYGFAVVSLLTWGLLSWMDPRSTPVVILADAWLIVVAVTYRMAKEWVDAPATPRARRVQPATPKIQTAVLARSPVSHRTDGDHAPKNACASVPGEA